MVFLNTMKHVTAVCCRWSACLLSLCCCDVSKHNETHHYCVLQVVRMLAVIVLLFATLWMPYRVMVVYNSFAKKKYVDLWFLLFSRTMVYVNSAVNPILYNVMSVKFRRAFRNQIFCGKTLFRIEIHCGKTLFRIKILCDKTLFRNQRLCCKTLFRNQILCSKTLFRIEILCGKTLFRNQILCGKTLFRNQIICGKTLFRNQILCDKTLFRNQILCGKTLFRNQIICGKIYFSNRIVGFNT